jgi:hypothetical protein
MIGINVMTEDRTDRVKKAAEKAAYRNLGHAAASIRKEAVASIETSPDPAEVGNPPHTRKGLARRAVRYDANKESAVIGFQASVIGEAMSAHEHGKEYKGQKYPDRPTMGPAMEANTTRFADDWRGSIGE